MTHRLSKLIFLLCAALWGRSLMAQPMNLRQCMDYAVAHSAQMRLSAADRSDELAAYRQSFLAAFTPSVGAQSYAYNQYGRNLDPETNTYTDFTTFHNGYSLSGSITLFEGFQALGKIRLAYLQRQKGLSHEQQCADQVRIAVMEAYYQLLYYRQLAEVLRHSCTTADSALTKVHREEELGRKGYADVVRMESELAERQYQLADAEGRRDPSSSPTSRRSWTPSPPPPPLSSSLPFRLPEPNCGRPKSESVRPAPHGRPPSRWEPDGPPPTTPIPTSPTTPLSPSPNNGTPTVASTSSSP